MLISNTFISGFPSAAGRGRKTPSFASETMSPATNTIALGVPAAAGRGRTTPTFVHGTPSALGVPSAVGRGKTTPTFVLGALLKATSAFVLGVPGAGVTSITMPLAYNNVALVSAEATNNNPSG
jgi:hypothetical protein